MKILLATALTFAPMVASTNVFAQPDCSMESKQLASEVYAEDYSQPNPESVSANSVSAKDGSVYYIVTVGVRNPAEYTVIFDDPSSCAIDTARVFEKKK